MTAVKALYRKATYLCAAALCLLAGPALAQQDAAQHVYTMPQGVHSRWTSPENTSGAQGQGARTNRGIKGAAYEQIPAHGHVDLLNVKGAGVVDRIKLSVIDRSPKALRSMRIEMYWDGAPKPAVSAPLGDFFGVAFGRTASYVNALFNDPEGRSFSSTVPMPYKSGARIVVYNDSDEPVTHIYYNVNFQTWDHAPKNMLYFHAWWHQNKAPVGQDFQILPQINGNGRFLGATIGVRANPAYGTHTKGEKPLYHWFGEGEIKLFLDGDKTYPSLVGTGVEDYFGTAWGMSQFVTPFSGCTIADPHEGLWSCYRYHMPDPVWFHQGIRVAIQQIGGGPIAEVRKLKKAGAPMKPISVDGTDGTDKFYPLLTMKNPPKLMDKDFPQGWVNYQRTDLWSAVAYFYLDTPTDNLPPIADVRERMQGVIPAPAAPKPVPATP